MDQYAVIGHPIKHSLSPFIHTEFAKQTQQTLHYSTIEAPLNAFADTVHAFIAKGGRGVNVTIPFKPEAFHLAEESSALAKRARAANTLLFREDGGIYADNTDGPGFIQDLTRNHHYTLSQKKVLVLGAGGAAKTIMASLLEAEPAQVVIANRSAAKAIDLAKSLEMFGNVRGVGLTDLDDGPFDLIVNTTSAGLTGEPMQLKSQLVAKKTWCYDLMYGCQQNPFLEWAQQQNPQRCLDGLGMLVEQAALAFSLWRGVYPNTAPIIAMLRHS